MSWIKYFRGKVKLDESLKKHTTFKIGGPVKFFLEPKDEADLKFLIASSKSYKIPYQLIGQGSNILAADKSFWKMVIKLSSPYFTRLNVKGDKLEAGAGCSLNKMAQFAKNNSLSGCEFLCAIPGTIGGALVMNAGAWGHDISEIVESVTILDNRQRIKVLTRDKISFSYRDSGLKRYAILSAVFKLKKKNKKIIEKNIKDLVCKRRQTQDLAYPSAGSFFKNPAGQSAGKLVDLCGLKGLRVGNAAVSKRHANFILNLGSASYSDVFKLMKHLQKKVKSKFGICLKPEVKIWN